MASDTFTTEELFQSAVKIVRNLPKDGPIRPSDDVKLKFYALFKQATNGPNETGKPSFYQFVEKYKWDAWKKLGDMTREDAMSNYIKELHQAIDAIPRNPEDDEVFEELLGSDMYRYWFSRQRS